MTWFDGLLNLKSSKDFPNLNRKSPKMVVPLPKQFKKPKHPGFFSFLSIGERKDFSLIKHWKEEGYRSYYSPRQLVKYAASSTTIRCAPAIQLREVQDGSHNGIDRWGLYRGDIWRSFNFTKRSWA